MNSTLEDFVSIINGYAFADDKDRVFTYIEFVKMYGYENDPNVFINYYKEYLTAWAKVKNSETNVSDTDFVASKLIEILKSITLDYSSYEEQDFISHINLSNKAHIKALSALFSRKIREITNFYKKKRNESVLIVKKNSIKGSKKSIQEIIYEKVFDFIFDNKNIVPSYKKIKRDLQISIEQYVDTYSEYFDIPRTKEFTDDSRREMLTANMNDVDYRMYLEIQLVVSELLYSGNVMLEEIPLIAQLGLDLSQNCVGDMLALKNSLIANTTINLVDINEQIALKRRLYEKFLGCDLWYLYVDLQGNVKIDVLCKAENPTGNLLNCGSPDTATIPSNEFELLSHIGLFFKPDKTSILKINAKEYSWTVDFDNLTNDTVYIFPDPNKYGDIGNNKDQGYPLIMEYKMNYDVRNMSSGTSVDDPLVLMTDQAWFSYYSKQDDVFKGLKNEKWEYSFTNLANKGFIANYQTDIWGNEWGLIKGYELQDVTDGNITTKKIIFRGKGYKNELKNVYEEEQDGSPLLLNGGYFENPEKQGEKFDFTENKYINERYSWSGLISHGIPQEESVCFRNRQYYYPEINFGSFGDTKGIQYEDHYGVVQEKYKDVFVDNSIITEMLDGFLSVNLLEPKKTDGKDDSVQVQYEVQEASLEEIRNAKGDLYVKLVNAPNQPPYKLSSDLLGDNNTNPKDFIVFGDTIITITDTNIRFTPYVYDGTSISSNLGRKEQLYLDITDCVGTKILFHEQHRAFYVLLLKKYQPNVSDKWIRSFILPQIIKFDPKNYTFEEIINPLDIPHQTEIEKIKNIYKTWFDFSNKKKAIVEYDTKLWAEWENNNYSFVSDFEIPLFIDEIGEICFTYNSALDKYLISFVINDTNGTPYLYEFKFRMTNNDVFSETLESRVYTLKELSYDENEKLTNTFWFKQIVNDGTLKDDAKYPCDDSFVGGFVAGNFTSYEYKDEKIANGNGNIDVMCNVYTFNDSYDVDYTSNVSILDKYTYEASVETLLVTDKVPIEYIISVTKQVDELGAEDAYTPSDGMECWIQFDEQGDLHSCDLTNLVNGRELFAYTNITSYDKTKGATDMNNVTDAVMMFKGCSKLKEVNADFDSLEVTDSDGSEVSAAERMFEGCTALTSFNGSLAKMKWADRMFQGCTSLTTFNTTSWGSNSLPVGEGEYGLYCPNTFNGCINLSSYRGNLGGLLSGHGMFSGCKLDADSVKHIADTISDIMSDINSHDEDYMKTWSFSPTSSTAYGLGGILTLGIDIKYQDNVQIHKDIQRIKEKGWILIVEWNGTEETISSENDITYEMLSNSEFNPQNYKTNCKQVKEIVDGIAYK